LKRLFSLILTLFFTLHLFASHVELTQKEKEWLAKHPVITLGTETTWAPFVINNKNTISGFDVDILNLINKNTGANFQLKVGTWKDMVQKAINKEIDGLSTSAVHEERTKFFNFSNSYTSTKKYFITLNNSPKNINSK